MASDTPAQRAHNLSVRFSSSKPLYHKQSKQPEPTEMPTNHQNPTVIMNHIALNSGKCWEVQLSNIPTQISRLLVPMVEKMGDFIPNCHPWRTMIEVGIGYAIFDIHRNRDDRAILNTVAWTQEGAREIWSSLKDHYAEAKVQMEKYGPMDEFMVPVPEIPPNLPWLASWILPAAPLIANPNDVLWMTNFEECLAATIVRMHSTEFA